MKFRIRVESSIEVEAESALEAKALAVSRIQRDVTGARNTRTLGNAILLHGPESPRVEGGGPPYGEFVRRKKEVEI